MQIPRVEGILKEELLRIIPSFEEGLVIYYGKQPLWRTACGLDELDIFIYDPTEVREQGEEYESYSLFCVDSYGDIYTYGMWETLDKVKEFLLKCE